MATVYPLRGWRVLQQYAERVAAVPYDVISHAAAAALAADNPSSFLWVTKPEIHQEASSQAPSTQVYQQGAAALQRLMAAGILVHEPQPCYYAYALTMGAHYQVGVVLAAAVADYEQNIVRKHEHTRPEKENERFHHMQALQAQSGKVLLVHRPQAQLAALLQDVCRGPATVDFVAVDAVRHQLWTIAAAPHLQTITQAFAEIGPLYIADGHHRASAAARVAQARRATGAATVATERVLAVAFATPSVQILPYHRIVRDLRGHTPQTLRHALAACCTVLPGRQPRAPGQFHMILADGWYTLVPPPRAAGGGVERLDVSVLQDLILGPLLGIDDPRRDGRIDFIGGICGEAELADRVRQGWAAGFSVHPTSIEALLEVADSGAVMPPKSTWFEPKLRDGLVVSSFASGA